MNTTVDFYQEQLLDLAQSPQCYGLLADATLSHSEVNASCGDFCTVTLKLSADETAIEDIGWTASGCIMSRAALSAVAPVVKGATVTDVLSWDEAKILEMLELPSISPGRRKCILLGLRAVQRALELR